MIVIIMGVSGCGRSTLLHALTARLGWRGLEPPEPEGRALTIPAGQEIDESVRQVVAEIARRSG